MKTCNICKTEKNLKDFGKNSKFPDQLSPWCKDCRQSWSKKAYQKNAGKIKKKASLLTGKNKKLALEYKGSRCTMCGYNQCPSSLQFHHLDPTSKLDKVSALLKLVDWDRIKEELDKCILVCANCHAEIHSNSMNDTNYTIGDRI